MAQDHAFVPSPHYRTTQFTNHRVHCIVFMTSGLFTHAEWVCRSKGYEYFMKHSPLSLALPAHIKSHLDMLYGKTEIWDGTEALS